MNENKVLNCDLHDYVEIACMFKIEVEITLKDQSVITGLPVTTKIDSSRSECLVLLVDNQQKLIKTSLFATMRAVKQNQHFDIVDFNGVL